MRRKSPLVALHHSTIHEKYELRCFYPRNANIKLFDLGCNLVSQIWQRQSHARHSSIWSCHSAGTCQSQEQNDDESCLPTRIPHLTTTAHRALRVLDSDVVRLLDPSTRVGYLLSDMALCKLLPLQ